MLRSGLSRTVPHCRVVAIIIVLCLGAMPNLACGRETDDNDHLVPAYFSPGVDEDGVDKWHMMCDAMNHIYNVSTAIMNPSPGPDIDVLEGYSDSIEYCHDRRVKVIGYVDTDYTRIPLADVLADIDAYYDAYTIDGIFLDEMANNPDEMANNPDDMADMTVQAYYEGIYRHVKQRFWSWDNEDVVGNPGSAAVTAWQIDTPVVDTLVIFEGTAESYIEDWNPRDWVSQRHGQLAHLVHSTPTAQRHEICRLFRERHADLIYVTNDKFPDPMDKPPDNPWDTLPSYWSDVAPKCV
jgi:hypothetical protein